MPPLAAVSVGTAHTERKDERTPGSDDGKTRIYFAASASGSSFSAEDFPFRLVIQVDGLRQKRR